jgi:amino acid permease
MKSPSQFKKMVNYTYIVTSLVYMTVAAAGYAMFGSATMQEVTNPVREIYFLRTIYDCGISLILDYFYRLHRIWLQFQNIIRP